ncbi:type I-F CRISPR-associated endoribonuclease Cas6/Csy4 [Zoogloea sp.]|uniref:type I-F CRISPR-associated endoribonuclease Cas6/Csy4 n=1 Tax=Zoogloea sp. TaxID=49181 RepID=UPI002631866C|nr:type I-F CRISPR-associated endoribonuclease Cas6/Csy4 [Zoogloea sp.]MDD3353509.1 type I-F CRISPR-associated endoribonuclease Cas6/Csy4 [Zoogloea sp.]
MDHYLEIRLLPDPEFPATTLMNALFSKLHRALVGLGTEQIGVSFPDVQGRPRSLGERLRLHGSAAALLMLKHSGLLKGMRDHVQLDDPVPVPEVTRHRVVRRVQSHSSPERERRRLIARKGLTPTEAMERIPDGRAELLDLPFVVLTSSSTGQQFRLFIDHGPVIDEPQVGVFSTYGLSPTATIPWF